MDSPLLSVSLTPMPWCKMRFSRGNEGIIEKKQVLQRKTRQGRTQTGGNALSSLGLKKATALLANSHNKTWFPK